MAQRLDLQAILVALLGSDDVYFQPPENVNLNFPCIVYREDFVDIIHADNRPYKHKNRYEITLITRDPDSPIKSAIAALPTCSYVRSFAAENLNHTIYTLYF